MTVELLVRFLVADPLQVFVRVCGRTLAKVVHGDTKLAVADALGTV